MMKKILITGKDSYIGISLKNFLLQYEGYDVCELDLIGDKWREVDFSGYDAIVHVAGIAHVKETKQNRGLYYSVNRDLAVAVAKKAKEACVKQFVFMSTMSVYGKLVGEIDFDTLPNPTNAYGKSKHEAEQAICNMEDEQFAASIIRPPMVYGSGCRGNFPKIVSLAKKLPVFPKVKNQRSMIYIGNLCSFIKTIIDTEKRGTFLPQNKEYVKTCDIARAVEKANGKKIYFSILLGVAVKLCSFIHPIAKKAFGSLVYKNVEEFDFSYCLFDNEESIEKSL